MKKAVILIKVEPGTEENVLQELGKKDFIRSAKIVFGDYDIVADVVFEKEADLETIILDEIGKIDGVKSTTTLIIAKEIEK